MEKEKLYTESDIQQNFPTQQYTLSHLVKRYELADERPIMRTYRQNSSIGSTFSNRIRKKNIQQPAQYTADDVLLLIGRSFPAIVTGGLIRKVKKQKIVMDFVRKLKRNIIKQLPQDEAEALDKVIQNPPSSRKSAILFQNQAIENIFLFLKFICILVLFIISSIESAFKEYQDKNLFFIVLALKLVNLFIIFIELGKKIKNTTAGISADQSVLTTLWNMRLTIGIVVLTLFSISFSQLIWIDIILTVLNILYLIKTTIQLEKIQNYLVVLTSSQKYWDLIRIILVNFFIAHCLSILLNYMGSISQHSQEGWYDLKNLNGQSPWYEKYVWGYYWGTTIMLTVGFGDLSANNPIEALCLIFVQTFSCIILAYNIAQVSKVIQKLRELDLQKNYKLKLFHNISRKYDIPKQLSTQIKNHIQTSIQMKKEFNFHQEQSAVDELPEKLGSQLKKQMNKNLFQKTFFFRDLTARCQEKLAQQIKKIVAPPQQIILKKGQAWKMLILKKGALGLVYRRQKARLNGKIIDYIKANSDNPSKLVSFSFIWQRQLKGDLKSLDETILATIDKPILEDLLKTHNQGMFEFYCLQRDRYRHDYDQCSQNCPICPGEFHSRIFCPKLHYVPLIQQVISKYLNKEEKNGYKFYKQQRALCQRRIKQSSDRPSNQSPPDNIGCLKQYIEIEDFILNQVVHAQMSEIQSQLPQEEPTQEKRKREKTRVSINLGIQPSNKNKKRQSIAFSRKKIGSKPNLRSGGLSQSNLAFIQKIQSFQNNIEAALKIMKTTQQQIIQVDQPKNYKNYFPKHNPENLQNHDFKKRKYITKNVEWSSFFI